MHLRQLEIVNFKAITCLRLENLRDAVVLAGPNGCGKSNVVDAIRWVLGEQAPTRLRGKSVEDLIYAGTGLRGPRDCSNGPTSQPVGLRIPPLRCASGSPVFVVSDMLDVS